MTTMNSRRIHRPRFAGRRAQALGISLIEALVALAVMAFGTLSVLGVQGSLRLNADIARQRSEALRIAQLAIEEVRRTDTLAEFDALVDDGPNDVVGAVGDTTYSVTRTVREATAAEDEDGVPLDLTGPRYKGVTLTVDWTDRTGQAQSLELTTALHGALPVLSGSLSVPTDVAPVRSPGGRHRAVPQEAVDQGDGTSRFTPPGAGAGVSWTFDNVSGVITRLCTGCDPVNALLLSGYVRFATTSVAPTGADAEIPPSPAQAAAVQVTQTLPVGVPAPTCYARLDLAYVVYYCAVQTLGDGSGWSGRSSIVPSVSLPFSAGAETDHYRVCRYTRLVGSPPAPSTANIDHPDTYANLAMALTDQNFLVIRAGDGTTAFACPGDDSSTPFVNGQTWLHQP